MHAIHAKEPAKHCVKSVQIQSYFWSVFSCIRTEYGDLRSTGKYGPEITPYLDTFYAVKSLIEFKKFDNLAFLRLFF